MTYQIKSIDNNVLREIDQLFDNAGISSWREHGAIPNEYMNTSDIELNDAWLNIVDDKVFIRCDQISIWLFNQNYGRIVII